MSEPVAVNEQTDGAPPGAAAPLADAAELALRLVEETARRQQAEARADTATATADAETARAALVGLRATAVQGIASVQARDRADRMQAMHRGLLALRSDLDGLRAAAEAAIAAGATGGASPVPTPDAGRPPEQAAGPVAAGSGADSVDEPATVAPAEAAAVPVPNPIGDDLARSARELLARGRLDVADEVIRGLEDAAARLRAQSPPPADG